MRFSRPVHEAARSAPVKKAVHDSAARLRNSIGVVARIRITRDGDCLRVDVSGRLTAGDLRRLEHACAPALLINPVSIELHLNRVTDIDRIAAAFVERIAARGAIVTPRGSPDREPRH
jgi:hypothetical protein